MMDSLRQADLSGVENMNENDGRGPNKRTITIVAGIIVAIILFFFLIWGIADAPYWIGYIRRVRHENERKARMWRGENLPPMPESIPAYAGIPARGSLPEPEPPGTLRQEKREQGSPPAPDSRYDEETPTPPPDWRYDEELPWA